MTRGAYGGRGCGEALAGWPPGSRGSASLPAVGADRTVYLIEFQTDPAGVRAEVVALDLDGRRKPGWPYRLPFDPAAVEIDLLTVSSDGRLYVVGGDTLLALDPDGHLSR